MQTFMSAPNLAVLFFERADREGDRPFLWARHAGVWRHRTWREAEADTRALSRGLRALGIGRGDRVAVVAENRPEWLLADLAIMAAGAVTVPAYITNTVEDHRHILKNAGVRAAIVSTAELLDRVLAAATPELEFVVRMDEDPPATGHEPATTGHEAGPRPALYTFDELRGRGRALPDDVRAFAAGIGRGDLACIFHTSGTGGSPRGVALTHGALLADLEGAEHLLKEVGLGNDVFLSFLPISHAYEHTAGQLLPIAIGAEIRYVHSASALAGAFREVRPTVIIAVPRVFEALRTKILQEVRRSGPVARGLFEAALRTGRMRYERRALGPVHRILDAITERLVRDRVRARFGGRLKAVVSGGAPLAAETGVFFSALGVRLLQGYGLTEAAPVVSCNPPSRTRHDTVGVPLRGVEVRTAADGEILVRGELVMQRYWGDPATTAHTLRDGWLYTGDVGAIDPDGYIRITDRKRDFIKNSGGEMISPQKVELCLASRPEIAQVVVFGDQKPYLAALIVPDAQLVKGAGAEPRTEDEIAPEVRSAIAKAVETANAMLAPPERIRRFLIEPVPFTVEGGELTPTLKLRRHRILELRADRVAALYSPTGGPG